MTLLTTAARHAAQRAEASAEPLPEVEELAVPDPASLPAVIGGVLALMMLGGFLTRFL